MQEEDNLIEVLNEAKEAVSKKDTFKLNTLSNRTIHMASIYKDTDNILIAVIIYAIAKILGKNEENKLSGAQEFCDKALMNLEEAKWALIKKDNKKFRNNLENIRDSIKKLSPNLKEYIQDIFRKAEINKASKIYEHGISLGETADFLGVTLWELAGYATQKDSESQNLSHTIDINSRIKTAKDFFK